MAQYSLPSLQHVCTAASSGTCLDWQLHDMLRREPSPSEAAAASQTNIYVNPTLAEPSYSPASEVRIKQTVTNESEGYSRDVRSAFSGLPKVKPQWRDYYMKILVVGECGQGKSFLECAHHAQGLHACSPCICTEEHHSQQTAMKV